MAGQLKTHPARETRRTLNRVGFEMSADPDLEALMGGRRTLT